ncbi:hypothetical protein VPNG_08200 [Cytospora leucostoma]|uniref:Uncharacterized protein n=1 Tax=Cytospora leucostoma TaxID=1230097 RepID=A0A423W779_9PEZI|nr:hypothetical protein VPNG_08200 [Cytospora leucostoma]
MVMNLYRPFVNFKTIGGMAVERDRHHRRLPPRAPLGPAHGGGEAFELFGRNNIAVARSAASVTRDLVAKADLLVGRLTGGSGELGRSFGSSQQRGWQQQPSVSESVRQDFVAAPAPGEDLEHFSASCPSGSRMPSSSADQQLQFEAFNWTTTDFLVL